MRSLEQDQLNNILEFTLSPTYEADLWNTAQDILKDREGIQAWAFVLALAARGAVRADIEPDGVLEFLKKAVDQARPLSWSEVHLVATDTTLSDIAGLQQWSFFHEMESSQPFLLSLQYATEELRRIDYTPDRIVHVLKRGTDQLITLQQPQ